MLAATTCSQVRYLSALLSVAPDAGALASCCPTSLPAVHAPNSCLRTASCARHAPSENHDSCHLAAGALEAQLEKCELTPDYKKGAFLQARLGLDSQCARACDKKLADWKALVLPGCACMPTAGHLTPAYLCLFLLQPNQRICLPGWVSGCLNVQNSGAHPPD